MTDKYKNGGVPKAGEREKEESVPSASQDEVKRWPKNEEENENEIIPKRFNLQATIENDPGALILARNQYVPMVPPEISGGWDVADDDSSGGMCCDIIKEPVTYTIGSGGDYESLSAALSDLECSILFANVTLQLIEDITVENLEFSGVICSSGQIIVDHNSYTLEIGEESGGFEPPVSPKPSLGDDPRHIEDFGIKISGNIIVSFVGGGTWARNGGVDYDLICEDGARCVLWHFEYDGQNNFAYNLILVRRNARLHIRGDLCHSDCVTMKNMDSVMGKHLHITEGGFVSAPGETVEGEWSKDINCGGLLVDHDRNITAGEAPPS